jgi:hypothetical protein
VTTLVGYAARSHYRAGLNGSPAPWPLQHMRHIAATLTAIEWAALVDAVSLASLEWEDDEHTATGRRKIAALDRAWRKINR